MPTDASSSFSKYQLQWPAGTDPVQIEIYMLKKGGRFLVNGKSYGFGKFYHYKALMRLLWPEDDQHRWSDLALKNIADNMICVLMGPASSNKTYSAAKFSLADYWVDPDNTCILVSSTDVRGLELRVWGTIKDLFNRARERFPYLPGIALESLHAITTDDVDDEDKARVLKKGIIGIPCLQGGKFIGLGKYIGIKQKRVRLIADECQLMGTSFLDAVSNLMSNPDFKAVFMGNPLDYMDPLGKASEPLDGWDKMPEPKKTTVWKTKFQNGVCVNLVGTDSPNFDYPEDQPVKYPYMISRVNIERVVSFYGKDSLMYYSQCVGVMKKGLLAHRVITADICAENKANDDVTWKGTPTTKIFALDAAYSGQGGDRCIGGHIEFGEMMEGVIGICVYPPSLVPVSLELTKSPEDQIAEWVAQHLLLHGIPIANAGYDSTGRGTLGSSFAKIMGAITPTPIEFGGRPTKRPVRHDLYIEESDNMGGKKKRHKRCDEHYKKFVTELWFSARYVIECGQMRQLPKDVMEEGCMREFGISHGNLIEIEGKDETKLRMGRSPDLFDWLVTAIEMARRHGFQIRRLGQELIEKSPNVNWARDLQNKFRNLESAKNLNHHSDQRSGQQSRRLLRR